MISAKIIKDSINESNRITTIEFNAPRFILAQFNTHRVFSRNAGSSRAIPVNKIIRKVQDSPVIPIWNKNIPGMQGTFDLTDEEIQLFEDEWLDARDSAVRHAKRLVELGAHKQIINRILEPYAYFKGVVTSTEWLNFFELREHHAAQPEIAILATAIRESMEDSTPLELYENQWHIPYITGDENQLLISDQLKISVARCARVSYRTFDDDKLSIIDKDYELYDQLFNEKHLSPFEHQARPDPNYITPHLHGNFNGWVQNRKLIENL